jgi:hypothetical protein
MTGRYSIYLYSREQGFVTFLYGVMIAMGYIEGSLLELKSDISNDIVVVDLIPRKKALHYAHFTMLQTAYIEIYILTINDN